MKRVYKIRLQDATGRLLPRRGAFYYSKEATAWMVYAWFIDVAAPPVY